MSMIRKWFPNINDYAITSPQEVLYNCIAWAAGTNDRSWWPDVDYYWPPGIPVENSLTAFVAAFATLGYEQCGDGLLEREFEKIAIYQDGNNDIQHAARQLPNGRWTSKLGKSFDIEHSVPEDLEGGDYGKVVLYMRRAVQSTS